MISHKHKCIFIHIPKCAGSTIENVLGHYDDYDKRSKQDHRTISDIQPFTSVFNIKMLLKHWRIILKRFKRRAKYLIMNKNSFNKKNLYSVNIKQFNEYWKFTIVRNPWSRAVSAYNNVIRDEIHLKKRNLNQDTTFSEFLEIEIERGKKGKGLLTSQLTFLIDLNGECNFDYIGRFENLDTVFEVVKSKFDLAVDDFPHEIKGEKYDYRNYYNDYTKKLITESFNKEIDFFNYSFN